MHVRFNCYAHRVLLYLDKAKYTFPLSVAQMISEVSLQSSVFHDLYYEYSRFLCLDTFYLDDSTSLK